LTHPLHYSPSSSSPFLKWLPQFSMFHIHACIESTSLYSSSFTQFTYPPLPTRILPLAWSSLHSCPSLFKCLFSVQCGFALEVYL
jgi:hypothetical protein